MSQAAQSQARLVDVSGAQPPGPDIWPPVKVTGEEIDAEIARLATGPAPPNGVRAARIVHPKAGPAQGFAPGVDVTLNVLLPGEATQLIRRNANQVEIGLQGRGVVGVDGQGLVLGQWDVCNIPSMRPFLHRNDGAEPWAWLTYSNAPLLANLGVSYFELDPPPRSPEEGGAVPFGQNGIYTRDNAPDIEISDTGARLRGYEFLTDIEVVENRAHLWPFAVVNAELAQTLDDGKRNILLLYNPATERRNGTTHSFFVTASSAPPGLPEKPVGPGHRHSSVAINYHYKGSGRSIVDGQEIRWKAGDLLLSAPGWSEHAHYMGPDGAGIFTVQDHPLQIGMESLIWQEDMAGAILTLGSEAGQTGYVGPRAAGR